MRLLACLLLVGASVIKVTAQDQRVLNVMPLPASYQLGTGELPITQSFSVSLTGYDEPRLHGAVDRIRQRIFRQTGVPLQYGSEEKQHPALVIHVDHASEKIQKLGEDESYRLEVTPQGAKLNAPTPLGALHGMETFLQLIAATPNGFAAPAVTIDDKPRFPWRGTMLDPCRHWMPPEVIKRTLDGMAAVKMNVLHWHLSEYQGFRVESKKYPKLHEMGSDGLYYTQAEVKDIIEYARDRGIRVVPEFDMPGHATSWFVGYPELASGPGPYAIMREWGIFDPAMDPTRDSTYNFLDKFIGEMAALFPDEYFHIGGDEVNGKQWDANPKVQEFMKAHNLKDNHDLQTYFTQRVQKIVAKHHKRMIGWDEVLHPDLPRDVVVQSWRGQKSLAEAARQGYRGLLSFGYYLDLMKHADYHYSNDPMAGDAANLTPEEAARILGGESCMWAEWISPETIDSRIWPRNAAIAERLWSPQNVTNVDSMYTRLAAESDRLEMLGLTHRSNYAPMLERIAGAEFLAPMRVLGDVVEPVKEYAREEDKDQRKPLNRLVDAARPESDLARRFNAAVDRVAGGQATDGDKTFVRDLLVLWSTNHQRLQVALGKNALAAEITPVSQNLSALGAAGLAAFDSMNGQSQLPPQWKQEHNSLLEEAKKPSAEVLIMVVPGIEKLVQAAK